MRGNWIVWFPGGLRAGQISPKSCQKINLHQAASPYMPHAQNPISGAVDICFLSDTPIEEWIKLFTQYSIHVEEGPIAKTGATGPLCSIYVRDPDGNLIEVSNLTS